VLLSFHKSEQTFVQSFDLDQFWRITMPNIIICDLPENRNLDHQAMSIVYGGMYKGGSPIASSGNYSFFQAEQNEVIRPYVFADAISLSDLI